MRPTRAALLRGGGLILALWIGGCTATPEPPAIVPDKSQPQITEPTQPKPVVKRTVNTRWILDNADDHCRATMTGAGASLEAVMTRAGATLTFRSPELARVRRGSAVPLRLNGPAGSWTAAAVAGGRSATAKAPMDEDAAGRMLVLLSGGTLQAGLPRAGLPTLAIPAAGARGSTWFGCVRKQLLP